MVVDTTKRNGKNHRCFKY